MPKKVLFIVLLIIFSAGFYFLGKNAGREKPAAAECISFTLWSEGMPQEAQELYEEIVFRKNEEYKKKFTAGEVPYLLILSLKKESGSSIEFIGNIAFLESITTRDVAHGIAAQAVEDIGKEFQQECREFSIEENCDCENSCRCCRQNRLRDDDAFLFKLPLITPTYPNS